MLCQFETESFKYTSSSNKSEGIKEQDSKTQEELETEQSDIKNNL